MLLVYPHRITPWLLLIPVVAVVQAPFSLALAIAVAAINVFYRDVGNIMRHVLRFWFYLSPTLYSVEDIHNIAGGNPLIIRWFELNPFTYILGSYRSLIYYGTAPDWIGLVAVFARVPGPAGAGDPAVQARRAHLREGPVSAPNTLSDHVAHPRPGPRGQVHPAAGQEADVDPPGVHPAAQAQPARPTSGRSATSRSRSARASRSASSGRTAPARARCSRSWPGSSCPPRARSRSTATCRRC